MNDRISHRCRFLFAWSLLVGCFCVGSSGPLSAAEFALVEKGIRRAPIETRPADNVIMVSVANFFGRTHLVDRGSNWGTTQREQLETEP